jgi:alkaline phosphatase D
MIPSEVIRFQELIRTTGAGGVVILSGDRHEGGVYRLPPSIVPYPVYEVTSSSLTHSFRTSGPADEEADPFRMGSAVHQNNFGAVRIDWGLRQLSVSLYSSDDCGLARQVECYLLGSICQAGRGVPTE